ncbi:MAG: sugar phosphate isomerase/epimerase [Maribacter sp.]
MKRPDMTTRRTFIAQSTLLGLSSLLLPHIGYAASKTRGYGVQLYTFRDSMLAKPIETLAQISDLGFKTIETAGSPKGYYYGLAPSEMRNICADLGMKLTSGHVHLDADFEQTIADAVVAGQEYLICSSMPSNGQTVENYQRVADQFNAAGEACKNAGLKFGYHNHEYEFEMEEGQVLYDVLLDTTQQDLVHMELDLGWVIVAGKDPLSYFKNYPGRFPLWHLKDMHMKKKESTEFGKGGLDIPLLLKNKVLSGVEHIFIEQEEYATTPLESMRYNLRYLQNI